MQPRRNGVWSPGLPGHTAKWRDMIWGCVSDLPQSGGHTGKQEEVPADPCSGIWWGHGASPSKQAWDDGDGRGWKQLLYCPSPWSKAVLTPWRVEHTVCGVGSLPSLFRPRAQPPPPGRRGMCCDDCLGGTSAISALQAQALAGHRSRLDTRLVPPSAWGGRQPVSPATATCEAACWGVGEHS